MELVSVCLVMLLVILPVCHQSQSVFIKGLYIKVGYCALSVYFCWIGRCFQHLFSVTYLMSSVAVQLSLEIYSLSCSFVALHKTKYIKTTCFTAPCAKKSTFVHAFPNFCHSTGCVPTGYIFITMKTSFDSWSQDWKSCDVESSTHDKQPVGQMKFFKAITLTVSNMLRLLNNPVLQRPEGVTVILSKCHST